MNNIQNPTGKTEVQTLKKDVTRVVAMLKTNLLYVLGYVTFFILFFAFVPGSITKYLDTRGQLDSLQKETEAMENSIQNVQEYGSYDLPTLIPYLDSLIPAKEDFFSVITATNQLANRRGVLLISHTSPFKSKDKSNAIVSMTLEGSSASLLGVLQDYSYVSGRFMTITKITYSPKEQRLTLDAQFPIGSAAPKLNNKTIVDSKPLQKPNAQLLAILLAEARSKGSSITLSSISTSFEKNASPFGSVVVSPTIQVSPSPAASPSASITPTQ